MASGSGGLSSAKARGCCPNLMPDYRLNLPGRGRRSATAHQQPDDAKVDLWTWPRPCSLCGVVRWRPPPGTSPPGQSPLPMPPVVLAAVLLMFAAFTLYSVGVWAVVLARRLRPWHAGLFWAGFLLDTTGTELMRRLAGGFQWSLHTATGAAALILMLGHALWATLVLIKRDEQALRTFYRISITVWTIWLIPFVTGLLLGRRRGL